MDKKLPVPISFLETNTHVEKDMELIDLYLRGDIDFETWLNYVPPKILSRPKITKKIIPVVKKIKNDRVIIKRKHPIFSLDDFNIVKKINKNEEDYYSNRISHEEWLKNENYLTTMGGVWGGGIFFIICIVIMLLCDF